MLVKICCITRLEDVLAAQEAGADCFGIIVDFPQSPRSLTLRQAVMLTGQASLPVVAVSVNKSRSELIELDHAMEPRALQLHGDESPLDVEVLKSSWKCEVWKVIHASPGELNRKRTRAMIAQIKSYADAGCNVVMIDTRIPDASDEKRYGGTGLTSDWRALREVVESVNIPVILAGGLTPANIAEAIATVQPFGVDCSSGVELSPGVKDPAKIRAFVASARRADTSHKSR